MTHEMRFSKNCDSALQLRAYTASDRQFLENCWNDALNYAYAFEGSLEAFLARCDEYDGHIGLLIIEHIGHKTAIGACRVQVCERSIYWLHTLFIVPEQRRKGFGRLVIDKVIRLLPSTTELLVISVSLDNVGALAFWTSMGFEPDAALTNTLKNEKKIVILKRKISR